MGELVDMHSGSPFYAFWRCGFGLPLGKSLLRTTWVLCHIVNGAFLKAGCALARSAIKKSSASIKMFGKFLMRKI